ncbi:hypothetical protein PsorP6_013897 [Peronosclerospora sorghi]|uniref:Uncharacterized protein n=1 Tax=Peronosclerospora sorghi TaxID=230839 RepID=A0ACC0VHD8_9STRA|nr:hypothetical protein PsorP6_013897 [Peronosclerospora sorghi]
MNMVRLESKAPMEQENRLIWKKVFVNGRERIALIDCGANDNLIHPGIVDDPGIGRVASVEIFDGHIRRNILLRAGHATVEMDVMKFDSIYLTEYHLPVTHDLILGKPWLTRFNPVIDWQNHTITVSSTTFIDTLDDHVKDSDLPWDAVANVAQLRDLGYDERDGPSVWTSRDKEDEGIDAVTVVMMLRLHKVKHHLFEQERFGLWVQYVRLIQEEKRSPANAVMVKLNSAYNDEVVAMMSLRRSNSANKKACTDTAKGSVADLEKPGKFSSRRLRVAQA